MNLKKGIIRLLVYFLIFLILILASVLYLFIRSSHEITQFADFLVRGLLFVSTMFWAFGIGIIFVVGGFANDKNIEATKLRMYRIILCISLGVVMIIWGLVMTVVKNKDIYVFILWCFIAVLASVGLFSVFKKRNML